MTPVTPPDTAITRALGSLCVALKQSQVRVTLVLVTSGISPSFRVSHSELATAVRCRLSNGALGAN